MPMLHAPLGWRPFSVLVDMTLPDAIVVPAPQIALAFTLQLYASSTTIYAATLGPFLTLPTDTLQSQLFEPRLKKGLTFHRTIVTGDTIGGQVSAGYGELELENSDGSLDTLYQNNTIDGRPILLKYGQYNVATGIPATFDTYAPLLSGIAQDWTLQDDSILVEIRDNGFKLDVPVSASTYAGTGGVEGTADMAGKRKPLAFGAPASVTPAQVDPVNLVYQVHALAVQGITAVYDAGYGLTGPDADYASYAALVAATVVNGHYATCKAAGLFRLGATPFGLITADVQGDNAGADLYVQTTARIARRLVALSTAVDLVDEGTFAVLHAGQPATVDYFVGLDENKTVRQALDELMTGIGGWCGFRRDGALECGRFIAPAGSASDAFTPTDYVVKSLKRVALPSGINPPPKRVRVEYARIWAPQTEVSAGVTDTRKQLLKSAASVAAHSNTTLAATITAAHLLAQDPDPKKAFFSASADAVAEADRLLSLWGSATRALYSFVDKSGRGLNRKIGDVISLTANQKPDGTYRYGLNATLVVIVGENTDTTEGTVELTVFG